MTTKELKEIEELCERKYKALINVERITGMRSMQSVVARAEWWSALDIVNYIRDRFFDDQNAAKPREDKKH